MESNPEQTPKSKPLSSSYLGITGLSIAIIAFVLFFIQHNIGDIFGMMFSKSGATESGLTVAKALGGVGLILGIVSISLKEHKKLAISAILVGASALMIELFLIAVIVLILMTLLFSFLD